MTNQRAFSSRSVIDSIEEHGHDLTVIAVAHRLVTAERYEIIYQFGTGRPSAKIFVMVLLLRSNGKSSLHAERRRMSGA